MKQVNTPSSLIEKELLGAELYSRAFNSFVKKDPYAIFYCADAASQLERELTSSSLAKDERRTLLEMLHSCYQKLWIESSITSFGRRNPDFPLSRLALLPHSEAYYLQRLVETARQIGYR